jgi:hypothetical protein
MNFSGANDQGLLSLWESVRRQVMAERASGGRRRFVGDNVRVYADLLRSEMDRRELKYEPINWPSNEAWHRKRSTGSDDSATGMV